MLGVERADKGLLQFGLNLFEGLSGDLLIKRGKDGMALGRSKLLKDVRYVGRVHLREAVLLDVEADAAGRIALDEINEVPRD